MQTQKLSPGFKIFLLQIFFILLFFIIISLDFIGSIINKDTGYFFEFMLAALFANILLQTGNLKEMIKRAFFCSLFFSLLFPPPIIIVGGLLSPHPMSIGSLFIKFFSLLVDIFIPSFLGSLAGVFLRFFIIKKPSDMQASSRN